MNNEVRTKQSEAMEKIADIATDAGLILSWESKHRNSEFYYFEGDWEEGDIDMESVDRIVITRTVHEDGSPLFESYDDEEEYDE